MNEIDDSLRLKWLADVMSHRPNNHLVNSERGIEVARMVLEFDKNNFSWRRSDPDIFWVDIQLYVKYKLSDDEILFIAKMQPGVNTYRDNAEERNAYAEFMRGLNKLKAINFRRENQQ